jgi:antitoxin component YwqK of YwqJK toxin-antitoxin module
MGLSYEYYGDGERVKEITGYVNGVPEGHWFAFDFMGELKGEAFYKDGALSEAPGVDGGEPAQ